MKHLSVLDSQGIDSTANTNGAGEHTLRSDVIQIGFHDVF